MSDWDSDVKLIDIAVNSDLINPSFEGYKLTLDKLPVKELSISPGISVIQPTDAQFSMQHAKIYANAGTLFFDPWNSSDASTVLILPQKDGNFYRVEYDAQSRQWSQMDVVVKNLSPATGDALPVSLTFPSKDLALLCNGSENVIAFSTTEGRKQWTHVFTFAPCANSSSILDSRLKEGKLEILVQTIAEHEKTTEEDHVIFDHVVAWVTVQTNPWLVTRKQDILIGGHADFIAFDESGECLVVLSSKAPKVLADSEGLLPTKEDEKMETEDSQDSQDKKHYVWTEKGDEVSIAFQLDSSVKKDDVTVKPSPNTLLVQVGGNVIVNGKLGGHIVPETATWTLGENNKLEVTLFKSAAGVRWSFLVEGCQRGRYEMDPALLDDAVTALEAFSSETKAPGAGGAMENFNSEQLEECDMTDDEMSTIFWFNRQKQIVIQQCDITGHQFLYESKVPGTTAKLCLRCDVDGALFRLDDGEIVHEATFNALGYIQASKSLRRWSLNGPDNSYAVIAEASNHAFIYWQPNTLETELRNRKTKEQVSAVAKQHVISLKAREDAMAMDEPKDFRIVAAHGTNETLFLATPDTLYAVCLK